MPSEALRMAPSAGNARCAHGDRRRVRYAAACQASERPRAISDADRGVPPENSPGGSFARPPAVSDGGPRMGRRRPAGIGAIRFGTDGTKKTFRQRGPGQAG